MSHYLHVVNYDSLVAIADCVSAGDTPALTSVSRPMAEGDRANPLALPYPGTLDAAERQADPRPAVPAVAGIHRHRGRHRGIL